MLLAASAWGQPAVGEDGKPLTFEIVSVRENKTFGGQQQFGPTPDGYRMVNLPLAALILSAYVPSSGAMMYGANTMQGFPEWTMSTRYDVDAKVSESDLAAWQRPVQQPIMLRAMLQAVLADRFALVVHRDQKQAPVYRCWTSLD